MKTLARLLSVLLLAITPATAVAAPLSEAQIKQLVHEVIGKPVNVLDIDNNVGPTYVNGGELDPGSYCIMWFYCFTVTTPSLILAIGKDVPEAYQRAMLYHELGHVAQWYNGDRQNIPRWNLEWDADEFAVRTAMDRGERPYLVADELLYLYQGDKGYTGDSNHGDLRARSEHARRYEQLLRGTAVEAP